MLITIGSTYVRVTKRITKEKKVKLGKTVLRLKKKFPSFISLRPKKITIKKLYRWAEDIDVGVQKINLTDKNFKIITFSFEGYETVEPMWMDGECNFLHSEPKGFKPSEEIYNIAVELISEKCKELRRIEND